MRLARSTALALLLLAMAAPSLHALCVGPVGPACAEYWKAKIIFDGVVEGEDASQRPDPNTLAFGPVRLYRFRVEHAWKDLPANTQTITVMARGGPNSDGRTVQFVEDEWQFAKGRRYLVWASASDRPGEVTTSRCSLTKEIERAADDLAFLRSLAEPATGGRAFGKVTRSEVQVRRDRFTQPVPLAEVDVRLDGPGGVRTTKTGEDGGYEFKGLQPGRYDVTAAVPTPLRAEYPWSATLEIPNVRACGMVDVLAKVDSGIGGVVAGGDRLPVGGVTVEAVLASEFDAGAATYPSMPAVSARTNDAGHFLIEGLPPGRYLIGVNLRTEPSAFASWPRTFHPGTSDRERATVVDLGLGQRTDIGILSLPAKLEKVTVSGIVVDAAGKPLAEVSIGSECSLGGRNLIPVGAITGEDGRFTVKLFETASCAIIARRPPAGRGQPLVRSERFTVTRDATPSLKLVLIDTR
jgi:hypothetical protein